MQETLNLINRYVTFEKGILKRPWSLHLFIWKLRSAVVYIQNTELSSCIFNGKIRRLWDTLQYCPIEKKSALFSEASWDLKQNLNFAFYSHSILPCHTSNKLTLDIDKQLPNLAHWFITFSSAVKTSLKKCILPHTVCSTWNLEKLWIAVHMYDAL